MRNPGPRICLRESRKLLRHCIAPGRFAKGIMMRHRSGEEGTPLRIVPNGTIGVFLLTASITPEASDHAMNGRSSRRSHGWSRRATSRRRLGLLGRVRHMRRRARRHWDTASCRSRRSAGSAAAGETGTSAAVGAIATGEDARSAAVAGEGGAAACGTEGTCIGVTSSPNRGGEWTGKISHIDEHDHV
jgi:hypothetical protein